MRLKAFLMPGRLAADFVFVDPGSGMAFPVGG
jgi:hypothetical protein